jgi:hypothetical protein
VARIIANAIEKNDPRKQPFAIISAMATIVVRGTNFFEAAIPKDAEPVAGDAAMLFIGRRGWTKTNVWDLFLLADGFQRTTYGDQQHFFLTFHSKPTAPLSENLPLTALVEVIDKMDCANIMAWFLAPPKREQNIEIIGGAINLIANSTVQKTFHIPPQNTAWGYILTINLQHY